jgi:anti-sigma regulatory factor (Ser/Thr protein kinase)
MEEGRIGAPQSVGPDKARLTLDLAPRLTELDRIVAKLEEFAGRTGLDLTTLQQVTLAIDELFTNIVSYGGITGPAASISLDVVLDGSVLRIALSDPGRPFDPREHRPPDFEASLEDRPIGGLGVHLARALVDTLVYYREDGRNHLALTKRIPGARP